MVTKLIRFLFGILAAVAFSCVHAGDVALTGIKITHQATGQAAEDVFIVVFNVSNNSGSTITGARAYVDRLSCDSTKEYQEAAYAATPPIPNGSSHHTTLHFIPGNEAYLRISLRQDRNAPSLAEVTMPRAKYDAKGAALHNCKPIKRIVVPVVPGEKMRMLAPK